MSFHPLPLPVGRTNDRPRLYALPLPAQRRRMPLHARRSTSIADAAYATALHDALDELRHALILADTRYGVTVAFADVAGPVQASSRRADEPLMTVSGATIHINRACLHSGSPLVLSLLATRLLGLAARLSAANTHHFAITQA